MYRGRIGGIIGIRFKLKQKQMYDTRELIND